MILTFPLPPSNNVYYRNARGITYLSKEGKLFKEFVALEYYYLRPHDKDIAVGILIHPKINKDGTINKKTLDIDNYYKGLFDSLKGILYVDDKQIKRKDYVEYSFPIKNGAISMYVRDYADKSKYMNGLDHDLCYDKTKLKR